MCSGAAACALLRLLTYPTQSASYCLVIPVDEERKPLPSLYYNRLTSCYWFARHTTYACTGARCCHRQTMNFGLAAAGVRTITIRCRKAWAPPCQFPNSGRICYPLQTRCVRDISACSVSDGSMRTAQVADNRDQSSDTVAIRALNDKLFQDTRHPPSPSLPPLQPQPTINPSSSCTSYLYHVRQV